jgi:hypothetical protein
MTPDLNIVVERALARVHPFELMGNLLRRYRLAIEMQLVE